MIASMHRSGRGKALGGRGGSAGRNSSGAAHMAFWYFVAEPPSRGGELTQRTIWPGGLRGIVLDGVAPNDVAALALPVWMGVLGKAEGDESGVRHALR